MENDSEQISFSPRSTDNALNINNLDDFERKNGTKTGQPSSHSFGNLYEVLSKLCEEKKMSFHKPTPYINYVPPKLTRGKIWYISYYAQDPATGKLKRIRVKLNRAKSTKERLAAAHALMGRISEDLSLGWNPLLEKLAPKAYKRLFDAFDSFLEVKRGELEGNSIRCYMSFVKTLRTWLEKRGCDSKTYACAFSDEMAVDFMAHIESDPHISPRTYNNYLMFCRVLFDWMMERSYISANPFSAIRKKTRKLVTKKRRLLSDDELARLWTFLEENNPEYLALCMLCYCCFMRPKEIALLKCSDVDLKAQTVLVRGEIAKNDNTSVRTIPTAALKYLARLDLRNPAAYLFGHNAHWDFRAATKPVPQRKIATYWDSVIRPACSFPMEVQFYSLKDTGITNMISAGVPVSSVKQQADHSSLAMTSIYCQRSVKAAELLKGVDILGEKK